MSAERRENALEPQFDHEMVVISAGLAALGEVPPTLHGRRDRAVRATVFVHGGQWHPILDDVTIHTEKLSVGDHEIDIREYRPTYIDPKEELATVVYFHGGGWVTASIDTYDIDVARLSAKTHTRVVSVGYRLAPEHPFPAPLDDCIAAVRAVHERGGWSSMSLAGDSTGGNLALGVSLALRGEIEFAAQLVFYPAIDPKAFGNRSYESYSTGFPLEAADLDFYYESYLPGEEESGNELAAPARAHSLRGLPPTVLVTAGFDPLRDEGRDFAARLIQSDVETVYMPNPTLPHGFQQMAPTAESAKRATHRAYDAFAAIIYGEEY